MYILYIHIYICISLHVKLFIMSKVSLLNRTHLKNKRREKGCTDKIDAIYCMLKS